jgi:hypothetical protein
MCLRGKQYVDAAAYVQRVLDWDPNCSVSKGLLRSVLLGHAMEQTSTNDVYGAVASYKRALSLLPVPAPGGEVSDELAGAEVQRAEISFLLGGLSECVGDMTSALDWYRCVAPARTCAHVCAARRCCNSGALSCGSVQCHSEEQSITLAQSNGVGGAVSPCR